MKMAQDYGDESHLMITGYDKLSVSINLHPLHQPFILFPDKVLENHLPEKFTDLAANDLSPVIEWQPEVVIVSTGNQQRFPSPAIMRRFTEANIGAEYMRLNAACRTYNVLMQEGRKVAALFFFDA